MLPLDHNAEMLRAKSVFYDFCDDEMLCFCTFVDGIDYVAMARPQGAESADDAYLEVNEQTKRVSGLPLEVRITAEALEIDLSQEQARQIRGKKKIIIQMIDVDRAVRQDVFKCIRYIFAGAVVD